MHSRSTWLFSLFLAGLFLSHFMCSERFKSKQTALISGCPYQIPIGVHAPVEQQSLWQKIWRLKGVCQSPLCSVFYEGGEQQQRNCLTPATGIRQPLGTGLYLDSLSLFQDDNKGPCPAESFPVLEEVFPGHGNQSGIELLCWKGLTAVI